MSRQHRYDTDAKWDYRCTVHGFADDVLNKRRVRIEDRVCVYLDTAKAYETSLLLEVGYTPEHLYPVNHSPAQIAGLTQTLLRDPTFASRARRVSRRTGNIVDVTDSLLKNGRFADVINLDLCSCLCRDVHVTMDGALTAMRPGSVCSVNVLCGREQESAFHDVLMNQEVMRTYTHHLLAKAYQGSARPTERHYARARTLFFFMMFSTQFLMFRFVLGERKWGFYTSGTQRMFWAAAEITNWTPGFLNRIKKIQRERDAKPALTTCLHVRSSTSRARES